MIVKKFGLSSLFLLLVSASSTGLTSQVGSAATSEAFSYSPVRQTICGCPRLPAWKETIKSTYRPPIYCPDILPLAGAVKHTIYCPDFRSVSQSSAIDIQSPLHLAYIPASDPDSRNDARDARDATRDARDAARGRDSGGVVDRAARFIDKGEAHLGAAYGRVNCTSCHGGGGGRNRNLN
jgi:hypothetical protein